MKKNLLKTRHIVENSYCTIKKNERVLVRKDHKINNYINFIFLGLIKELCNMLAKLRAIKINDNIKL